MSLRVMSWNTFCSPTMLGRIKTKKEVHDEILKRHKNIDVLLLQELGPFRVGLFTYAFYRLFRPIFHRVPWFLKIWDYLMMAEARWLPSLIYDDHAETVKFAHSLGYEFVHVSKDPRRYMSPCLLTLSKYPIKKRSEVLFERDLVHMPAILETEIEVKGKKYQVINCHLVPTLKNWLKPTYVICNTLNFIRKKNTVRMRENSLKAIKNMLKKKRVIFGGDFNINWKNKKEYNRMLEILNLANSSKKFSPTYSFSVYETQLDYILHSKDLKVKKSGVRKIKASDHDALYTELEEK